MRLLGGKADKGANSMLRAVRLLVGGLLLGTVLVSAPAGAASRSAANPPPITGGGPGGLPPISWSGYVWEPRQDLMKGAPYDNYWSALPNTVYVDSAGRLHLWIQHYAGHWWSSQIESIENDFGYGTYTFVVRTPSTLFDPRDVLGLFTYNASSTSSNPYVGHLENDIEISRWAVPKFKNNMQYAVQPFWLRGNQKRLAAPRTAPVTYQFQWTPSRTVFTTRAGANPTGRVLNRWVSHSETPRAGTRVNLNFWLFGDVDAPQSGRPQEAVIDSFTYRPAA